MPDPCGKPTFIIPTITSLMITGAVMTGCAGLNNMQSQPLTDPVPEALSKLSVEKEVPPLTRQEVITGINECEAAGMRPIVLSAKRKINNQLIPSVVEVTCLPKFK
jgi:hypothetical protein